NKGRETVYRASANVDRIRDRRCPVVQQVTAEAADQPADEHEERQPRAASSERFVQFLDRERRVRVHPAIALVMGAFGRRNERVRIDELRHQPVNEWSVRQIPKSSHPHILKSSHPQISRTPSYTFASGRMLRISKREIIG